MDFKWVVDALRRGLRVTRKALAGDPPIYLYMSKTLEGDSIIMKSNGTRSDFEWKPTGRDLLDADDWEEYVDPKKDTQLRSVTGETIKVTPEEMPLWPGVTQEGPFAINPLPLTGTMGLRGEKPAEEPDLDAEANKAIALVARNIAENLAELLRNPAVQRILQGNANTNQDKED